MPPRESIAYFGAGPARLPTWVIQASNQAMLSYNGTGLGICEISHRSTLASELLEDTKSALKSLMIIPDTHDILFMQGGASAQFSAVPLNLVAFWVENRRRIAAKELGDDATAVLERVRNELKTKLKMDYLVTGSWSLKASQEAALQLGPFGKDCVNVALDTRQASGGKFRTIPDEKTWKLTPCDSNAVPPAFIYYCDNETVDGVEFPQVPKVLDASERTGSKPLIVADMSSNILTRPVDVGRFDVIFFGAQKNISSAGLTIAIVRKDILTTAPTPDFLNSLNIRFPPSVLDWPTTYKANSLYNTLELHPVYIANLVIRDLLSRHGTRKLEGQEDIVRKKAAILYDTLETHSDVYRIVPDKLARSRTNLCFRIKDGDEAAEKSFLKGAEELSLLGLKGHRSVGGIRISNYNVVTIEQVQKLAKYLTDFANS
ncbi:Phosphoserine transaminase [Thelotrema lepadinum]|nr:Phosphoserine transaminase [Thelotrema lepadinum]